MAFFLVANSLEHKRSEKCKEISETPLEKKKKNAVVYFISCSILCCVTRSSFISSSITVFGQNFRVCYQYSKLPPVIVRYLWNRKHVNWKVININYPKTSSNNGHLSLNQSLPKQSSQYLKEILHIISFAMW